jgi:hypothetical protein
MPEADLIELFAQPLSQSGIRYLVSGSVAAMLYGIIGAEKNHEVNIVYAGFANSQYGPV